VIKYLVTPGWVHDQEGKLLFVPVQDVLDHHWDMNLDECIIVSNRGEESPVKYYSDDFINNLVLIYPRDNEGYDDKE
jgi:hypothetical protein